MIEFLQILAVAAFALGWLLLIGDVWRDLSNAKARREADRG